MFNLKSVLIILASTAFLAACQTAPSPSAAVVADKITTASNTVKEKAAAAQGYATQICGYLPTITSVISIFNSGFGADAKAVGAAICNAVTTLPFADGPGDRLPRVNGVVVTGKFVQ